LPVLRRTLFDVALLQQVLAIEVFQVMLDVISVESNGVVEWRVTPAISSCDVHTTLLDNELDAFQMSFGSGEMQGSAPVVVAGGHVMVCERHQSQSRQIAVV